MAERCLITGGAGFIGLHLGRRLAEEGATVTLLDNLSRGRVDDELLAVTGPDVRLVEHDLTEPIPSDLLPEPFDAVYHLAAVVGVERTAKDPALALRTNISTTTHLLDWCDRTRPATVFLSSTSEVADGAAQVGLCPYPVPEDTPFVLPRPQLARASYALSKMVSETMLLQRQGRFRVRIGRYFNVYGPRMGYAHVIPKFIQHILDGIDPFPIYGACQSRAFCYVSDAVNGTIALVRCETNAPLLANIGDDRQELSVIELAQRLFTLAGTSPELAILDPPRGSPDRRLPDLTTLRDLTGYEPRVGLDDGLRRTFAWYSQRWRDAPMSGSRGRSEQ